MSYQRHYLPRFEKDIKRYANIRERIFKQVKRVSDDPYTNTGHLGHPPGAINLKGCRSAHVGMNFRIIFVVCEECRNEPECEYCFCEGLPDQTVVFLTVGPHDQAYSMQ